MRHLAPLLLLTGCWKLESSEFVTEHFPYNPDVGAPEGWVIDRQEMDLRCPDGETAAFYLIYPEDKAAPPDQQRERLPLALIFHSGTFDFISLPRPEAPTVGKSYQEIRGETKRITAPWAIDRIYATLGMYVNDDGIEYHVGALPAALATKGIAMMMPENCWGDWWHNRESVEENNFQADYYFRNGRTAAEFAFLHATTAFPPGNPVDLPFGVDPERIYLIGLGEGTRAVSELLSLREDLGGTPGSFLYRPSAIVLDSPTDDLRPFYDITGEAYESIRSGLNRIFPGGRDTVMRGTLAFAQLGNVPDRTAMLYSANDTQIPAGANDLALAHLAQKGSADMWHYRSILPEHVLSNADPSLAKAIADYLVDGVEAVPAAYLTPVE
ncbi:MAG TPA: hypothetical protein PKA64_19790 [Myxococcota bacterium]|nr:hypothetical protein [Myxococcota bacterium]